MEDFMPINTDYREIDFIKLNAMVSNGLLDSKYEASPSLSQYAEFHLEDCKENSTIGLLARQNERTNDYPKMRKHNLNILNNVDSFKKEDKEFKDMYNDMYPKTGKVRKQLIKHESIVLDEVKPIKKDFTRTFIKLFGNIIK